MIKKETPRNTKKYAEFRAKDKSGRGHTGSVGFKATQAYPMGVGPSVGGTAKKSTPLKGATKGIVKAAKSLTRFGTGSGASKQARLATKRSKKY